MASAAAFLLATSGTLAATKTTKRNQPKKRGRKQALRRREPVNLDPDATISGIYQRAMKDVDGRVVTLSFAKADRPYIFSAALVAAWEGAEARPKTSEDDIGPIDFDPVTNSQGARVRSYEVTTENKDDTGTTLAVTIETGE